jgi:pimeloyl-ACP methyl ester carboxylesterase
MAVAGRRCNHRPRGGQPPRFLLFVRECTHEHRSQNISQGQHVDRGSIRDSFDPDRRRAAGRRIAAPIVLVHGAWHGGWCWKRVAPRLRAAGHDVFTPTPTGVGERVHLAGPGVNLVTHVTDVLQVLEAEELSDVVLVGHSYAGMVVTGVADRAATKLRSLVYLDAFVPDDGRNMIEYVTAERRGGMIKEGEGSGHLNPLPAKVLGLTEPADHDWVTRRMTPQPYGTFSQPLRFQHEGGAHLPRTYVYCSNPPTGSFDQFATRFRNDPKWRFHELKTGHDCMVTQPEALARIILEAV